MITRSYLDATSTDSINVGDRCAIEVIAGEPMIPLAARAHRQAQTETPLVWGYAVNDASPGETVRLLVGGEPIRAEFAGENGVHRQ